MTVSDITFKANGGSDSEGTGGTNGAGTLIAGGTGLIYVGGKLNVKSGQTPAGAYSSGTSGGTPLTVTVAYN